MFPGFGQVLSAPRPPYSYERLVLYAYTVTDSVTLLLGNLFGPFPETTLLAPMRNRLRFIAATIASARGDEPE